MRKTIFKKVMVLVAIGIIAGIGPSFAQIPAPKATPTPATKTVEQSLDELFNDKVDYYDLVKKPEDLGLLNGRRKTAVTPPYPAAAVKANIGGLAQIRVTIDEEGDVTKAEALSGDPLLTGAAIGAAWQTKFVPYLIGGKPAKMSGYLAWDFKPGKKLVAEPPADSNANLQAQADADKAILQAIDEHFAKTVDPGVVKKSGDGKTPTATPTPVPKASPERLPDIYTKKDTASPETIDIFNKLLAEEYEKGAKESIKKYDYKAAVENYGMAIELQPERTEYYIARGTLYDNNMPNMKEYALIDYAKAIDLEPKSKQALLGTGEILAGRNYGRYEKAIPYFTAYIALDQKNFVPYASRGMCLGKLGRKAEAIVDLKKALQIEPDNEYAKYNLNALLTGGKVLNAAEWSAEYGNTQVV